MRRALAGPSKLFRIITSRDGAEEEFRIRGTARTGHDRDVQRRYGKPVANSPGRGPRPGRFRLAAVGISQAARRRQPG